MSRRSTPFRPPLWRLASSLCCAAVSACCAAPEPNARYTTVEQGSAERGLRLLARYQCGSCHEIPDSPFTGRPIGPPLHAYGARAYIAGQIPNGPVTLQRWLIDPSALLPGTTMPGLGVTAEDARDMAAYLLSLP